MKNVMKSLLRIIGLLGIGLLYMAIRVVYENELEPEELLAFFQESYVSSDSEYASRIREGMLEREACVRINYRGSREEDIEKKALDILETVFEMDEESVPYDADYLEYTYKGVSAEMVSLFGIYQITYYFDYLESAEETEYVNRQVTEIVRDLELKDCDDYTKVREIHDYIVKELDYDKRLLNATPYQALTTKKATCQGYATLFYRMAEEAGVEVRIIGGTADGEPHAWNIVKLDGLWYNIDCTWDDPVGKGVDKSKIRHQFFLRSDKHTFLSHIRDSKYQTAKFQNEYKMAEKDYSRKKK
ncbi:MAG: transglutaminase domain-containing protein [Clostridiales bacterium]|nr:transglutaminase domain-containing protein [Clostridiales bacterium]